MDGEYLIQCLAENERCDGPIGGVQDFSIEFKTREVEGQRAALVTADNLCQAQEETAFHKIRLLRQSEVLNLPLAHTQVACSGAQWL